MDKVNICNQLHLRKGYFLDKGGGLIPSLNSHKSRLLEGGKM